MPVQSALGCLDDTQLRALSERLSGALLGLSMALYEGAEIRDDQVYDRNLGDYTPLCMIYTPDIEIGLVCSTEVPVGLCVTGIAQSVVNATLSANLECFSTPRRSAKARSGLRDLHSPVGQCFGGHQAQDAHRRRF
ncbi:hypothetical protein [Celeribacter sp.]|uniref:hypothetical protein n=1 Tax=Celeribacter sp. TaxID=1890673 RepID=UPI003A8E47C2